MTFCQTSFFEPKSVRISNLNLGADEVVGVFREGGVVDQAGAVHQVEEVAVVRPIVKQRQGLGHGVGLQVGQKICIHRFKLIYINDYIENY